MATLADSPAEFPQIWSLAFDEMTWKAIALTLCISWIVMTCMHFLLHKYRKAFHFDVLMAFFGFPQSLPTLSFARILFTAFIMWSLIIRSCYKGFLYETKMLPQHEEVVEPKSIDEIFHGNYTFFATKETYYSFYE